MLYYLAAFLLAIPTLLLALRQYGQGTRFAGQRPLILLTAAFLVLAVAGMIVRR